MARGAPDWTTKVQITITAAQPQEERAAGGAGHKSGVLAADTEVISWTVDANKVGELKEILIISDDYAHTKAKVTVGDVEWCANWSPTSAMPIIFEDLRLSALTVVKVEVESIDSATIDVDAIIVAKEVG